MIRSRATAETRLNWRDNRQNPHAKFGRPPRDRYVTRSQVIDCVLADGHRGRHRGEGASWEDYGEDFAPSEYAVGEDDGTVGENGPL